MTIHKLSRTLSLIAAGLVLTLATTCPAQSQSGNNQSCNLVIHVDGMRNTTGKVGTVVFKSPEGWPEDTSKAVIHGPTSIETTPSGLRATQIWPNLPPGDYAVAAIHDENSNHKLDKNMFGWPLEGFGFSNNPHVGLKAPNFTTATFHLACPATEIAIHLQYK